MLRRQRIELLVAASRASRPESSTLPPGGRRRKAVIKSAVS